MRVCARLLIGYTLWCAALATAGGCDRQGGAPPAPTTEPAAASSPATTAAVAPGPVELKIAGTNATFPPAHARIAQSGGTLYVQLFSEDPPPPTDGQQQQPPPNSFYFDMTLDGDDVRDAGALATWRFSTPSRERSDSPNGITLNGGQHELQPVDVEIELRRDAATGLTHVKLAGEFTAFLGDTTVAAQQAHVEGTFDAVTDAPAASNAATDTVGASPPGAMHP